ncbi:hypothetical protein NO357_10315 [Marimonas arenosa]|uniref:Uncharacterized protein n=1 Tax=Marimonas arenosa TaxID=1795305 RepID=A0AAE4B5F7_9RHOB|nr:hypothetical protein [Marimonas arenosa]
MNIDDDQARHMSQWHTESDSPAGVALISTAPQRHFPNNDCAMLLKLSSYF